MSEIFINNIKSKEEEIVSMRLLVEELTASFLCFYDVHSQIITYENSA